MKVVLHIEQLIGKLPVYHVALGYQDGSFEKRYDFHPKNCPKNLKGRGKKQIFLGNTKKQLHQIEQFESNLNKEYFLMKNDCRHYTKQLIEYTDLNIDFDITNLLTLIHLFYF